jgi:hypothetical protein
VTRLPCRDCIKEIGLPEGTVVTTPSGVVARIGKAGRVDPNTVQKSALAGPTLRDVHRLLLSLEPTDMGGGKANYRRLDLT